MFGGFNATKLKTQLKMAVSRIQIASNKKAALLKQNMRQVAVLLAEEPPKEEMAGIKAEALIRDDNLLEALEIVQLECEMLHERIKLIDFSKNCPADLVSVVSTVIWASHRVDIPELLLVRKQFRAKYGKKFEDDALENKGNVLNERVVAKLSVQPPAAYLVHCYLERICQQFEVDWKPKVQLSASQMVEPMSAPVGVAPSKQRGTGLGAQPYETPEERKYNGVPGPPPEGFPVAPPPVVPAQPYIPPAAPARPPATSSKVDDFKEVDIFIPPAAPYGAPQAGGHDIPSAPSFYSQQNGTTKDNGSEGGGDQPASGGGAASYEDLAARFNNLKNM